MVLLRESKESGNVRVEVETAATGTLIDSTTAKLHLRVDHSYEDDLISDLLDEVTDELDGRALGCYLRPIVLNFKYRRWESPKMYFPVGPVRSIVSVSYVDSNGSTQTWDASNYDVVLGNERRLGYIKPAYNVVYPTLRRDDYDVTVQANCGFASIAAIPARFLQQVKLRLSYLYENRGDVDMKEPASYKSMHQQNTFHTFD